MSLGWPVTLQYGDVTLRPLAYRDARAWRAVRRRNAAWLIPWDATVPPGGNERPATFRTLVTRLHRHARHGSCMPFAIDVDGRFAGQVTVNNIVRGSAQFASVGYWLDRDVAGRGVMPTSVALGRAAPDRGRDPTGELQLAARRREARHPGGRLRAALPPHRRRLARPPDLRHHRRGLPRRHAGPTFTTVTRVISRHTR
jgi:hypothetical protein